MTGPRKGIAHCKDALRVRCLRAEGNRRKSSLVFPSGASIWKVSLTYFASTPTRDSVKNLLCRNRIAPSTALHKDVSATIDWLETAINNCPSATAFSLTNVKLRSWAGPGNRMMNDVAPRGSAKLVFIPLIFKLRPRIGESLPDKATDPKRNNPAAPNRRARCSEAMAIEKERMALLA